MPNYRIACQECDNSWTVKEFEADDDPDAISYALSIRTSNRCDLFYEDRWIATFDGLTEDDILGSHANENTILRYNKMETEVAYFYRRALEEREQARISGSSAANLAHLRMAEHLESLARAVQAERRRLSFYDVNASPVSSILCPRKAIR